MVMTASTLIAQVCNLKPYCTIEAESDSQCSVCGTPIAAGAHVDETAFPNSFTNYRELVDWQKPYRCNACVSIMSDNRFQMQLSNVVFTRDAVYPFNKKIDRGYFLLNPPKPPFVMVLGVTKQQHVVWRAPVNQSQKRFTIQVGDNRITIRHPKLVEAVKGTQELKALYGQVFPAKQKRIEKLGVLTFSEQKGARVFQNEVSGWVNELLEYEDETVQQEAHAHYYPISQLNAGEAWALDFAMAAGECPSAIDVNK